MRWLPFLVVLVDDDSVDVVVVVVVVVVLLSLSSSRCPIKNRPDRAQVRSSQVEAWSSPLM